MDTHAGNQNRQGSGRDDSRNTKGRKADDCGSETDTNDNDDGHGDLGDSLYARKRRELLKLARSLTDLGCVTSPTKSVPPEPMNVPVCMAQGECPH